MSSTRAASAPLDLVSVASVAVPESIALIDARIHPNGTILAWGNGRGVWLHREGAWKQIGRNVARAVGARFVAGDSVIEVVDRARGAVVAIDIRGSYKTLFAFRATHVVESADALEDGWFVAGTDVEGDFVGTRLWTHERRSESNVLWRRGTSAKSYSARVSSYGGDAMIAQYGLPFEIQRVGRDQIVRKFPPLPESLLVRLDGRGIARTDTARWGAMRLIPIRDGEFIQSFTDLRSDHRMLVLRDRNGAFGRAKQLDAPVSFLDADSSSQQVLAARRTARTEFVIYRLQRSDSLRGASESSALILGASPPP